MTDVEINMRLAELVGMKPLPTMAKGAFWDEHLKRTRLILGSDMHDARKKMGIRKENPPFVFDVFSSEADLMRVERAMGLDSPTPAERIKRVMKLLC